MPYVLDRRDLRWVMSLPPFFAEFVGAEMLVARFRTDPAILGEIIPRPLRPAREPLCLAFVARYPETNFGVSYHEGALLVDATYRGELGMYCLAMPVDVDVAMIEGRETLGYPKKMADAIALEVEGQHVVGRVDRRGTTILQIEGTLGDEREMEPTDLLRGAEDLEGGRCLVGTFWLFKYTRSATTAGFESAPRLVREPVISRPRAGVRDASVDLQLNSSATDPLGDVPVIDVVDAWYGTFDNTMLPGRTVRRVRNILRFAPSAFARYDAFALMERARLPSRSALEKLRLRRKLKRY